MRNELDEKEKIHLGRIKDFEKTIERLEIENSKLKNDQFERPDTEEIGIQKDDDEKSEINKDAIYKEALEALQSQIFDNQITHEKEMQALMIHKRIQNPNVIMPKELNITDPSEIGSCNVESKMLSNEESLIAFFESRHQTLIMQIQHEMARSQYSSAESALARLKWAQDERLQLVSELRISKDETKNVRAEMETIRRSYEDQMNTMTEEMAQLMNTGNGFNSLESVTETEKTPKKSRFSLFSRNNT